MTVSLRQFRLEFGGFDGEQIRFGRDRLGSPLVTAENVSSRLLLLVIDRELNVVRAAAQFDDEFDAEGVLQVLRLQDFGLLQGDGGVAVACAVRS